jgi:ATP-dependent Clp protease ATP-binding subunit ClpC
MFSSAMEELKLLNHNYVGTEHQLLGLLREKEGIAVHALLDLGLDLHEIRKEVYSLLGHDLS